MYFQYLLKRNETDMISKFLKAQMENPNKNDWYLDVKNDLEEFGINFSQQELKSMSKHSLKRNQNKKLLKIYLQRKIRMKK